MINKELETRLFLEGAKNLCITTQLSGVDTKQYITKFNKIKDYDTVGENLKIGNGRHNVLNVNLNWDKVEIKEGSIDKLFIPVNDVGNILIESF